MSKYRMYIDESGSHHYDVKQDEIKNRYLCLLGVMLSEEENRSRFNPAWTALRNIFTKDTDIPPALHYIDVLNKRNEFAILGDDAVRKSFDVEYLRIISEQAFTLCCVVLDKKSYFERYEKSVMHPYHYCFNILLKQYVSFLNERDGVGDIMAEGRGNKEDKKLKESYHNMYNSGSQFIDSEEIQRRIRTGDIKIRRKEALVSGLEFTDMLVTIMKFFVLSQYDLHILSDNFSKKILDILVAQGKIMSAPDNQNILKEYGLKFLR